MAGKTVFLEAGPVGMGLCPAGRTTRTAEEVSKAEEGTLQADLLHGEEVS